MSGSIFLYLGPGGGTLPAFSSSMISSMSFGVRSSWKQEDSRAIIIEIGQSSW